MKKDEVDALCAHCGRVTVINKDELRTPYYCWYCR
jgi:hypothetical protein